MAGETVQHADERVPAAAGDDEPTASPHGWHQGADPEAATGHVLDELAAASGWAVLHDVPWPGRPLATIDHVVIGPSGVFVVDAHGWAGQVTVSSEELRHEGRLRMDAVFGAATAGEAVAHTVPGLDAEVVQPLVCLERDEWLNGRIGDVTIGSTQSLVPILKTRRQLLDAAAVDTIVGEFAAVIAAERERAVRGPVRPRTIDPVEALEVPRERRHRGDRRFSVTGLLVRIVAVLALGLGALAFVHPATLDPVADFVDGLVTFDDGTRGPGSPRDGSPRDGSPRDGSPRDGSPRDGSPRDGSLTDGPADQAE